MIRVLMLAGLVLGGVHARAPSAITSTGHFAIVVEHAPTGGWSATCDSGCRWKTVTLDCRGCEVRIDAAGIALATTPANRTEPFAFVLHDDASGWSARALHGTAWRELSWQCRSGNCRARVDETGVSGA